IRPRATCLTASRKRSTSASVLYGARLARTAPGSALRRPAVTSPSTSATSSRFMCRRWKTYGLAQKQPWRTAMAHSWLRAAATRPWCSPSTTKLASARRVPAVLEPRLDRDAQRNRADDVGRAGLLTVRQIGPYRVVPGHDADRAAAHDLWRTGEKVARRNQHAGAIRRVHLVS